MKKFKTIAMTSAILAILIAGGAYAGECPTGLCGIPGQSGSSICFDFLGFPICF